MASTINATTSSGIVATADNTGQLALQAAGTTVMTITSTGVTTQVGAPAFSAYLNTNVQNLTLATWTKVQMGTEEFDTASCYDTTNYRFTPTVAGYYQVNALLNFDWSGSQFTSAQIAIYKNGSAYRRGVQESYGGYGMGSISTLIYMNGTSDYLELYTYIAGGSGPTIYGGSTPSQIDSWSGFLVRSA